MSTNVNNFEYVLHENQHSILKRRSLNKKLYFLVTLSFVSFCIHYIWISSRVFDMRLRHINLFIFSFGIIWENVKENFKNKMKIARHQ